LPSPSAERVGILISTFRSSMAWPTGTPCLRFDLHLTMLAARLGAKMESLSPFLKGSYIPNIMPVLSRRTCCSLPCHPKKFQRSKTANNSPVPPNREASESTLQTIASAVA
jgi:hypothetical protein